MSQMAKMSKGAGPMTTATVAKMYNGVWLLLNKLHQSAAAGARNSAKSLARNSNEYNTQSV